MPSLPGELKCVDLIAWDSLRLGNGYRSRRRGDYLLVLQKPPLAAKSTWRDHGICNRWPEKVDRRDHQHVKPIGLIGRLIGAVTTPGDLVVDPAAGSFVVMHAAKNLGRNFVGCDIAYPNTPPPEHAQGADIASERPRNGDDRLPANVLPVIEQIKASGAT